jgi:hypothetical protein
LFFHWKISSVGHVVASIQFVMVIFRGTMPNVNDIGTACFFLALWGHKLELEALTYSIEEYLGGQS